MIKKILMVTLFLVPILGFFVLYNYSNYDLINLCIGLVSLAFCFHSFLKPDNFYSVQILDTELEFEYDPLDKNSYTTITKTKFDISNAQKHTNVKYKLDQFLPPVFMFFLANAFSYYFFTIKEVRMPSFIGFISFFLSVIAPWLGKILTEEKRRKLFVKSERGDNNWHIENEYSWENFKSRLR